MLKWLKKRKNEKSTFLGLGMLLGASGIILKSPELQMLGSTVANGSDTLSSAGGFVDVWPVLVAGLGAILYPTKKD